MGGKILIVDDEKDMLALLKRIIAEDTEYEVTTETSPLQALDRFKNQPFDMVITDLKMPEMDGIQLLEHLKKIGSDVSVVVMTPYGTIETAVEATQKGAYDYITKPFRRECRGLISKRPRKECSSSFMPGLSRVCWKNRTGISAGRPKQPEYKGSICIDL